MDYIEYIGYHEDITNYEAHNHTSCEIMYCKEGALDIYANDNVYSVGKDTLCAIPCGLIHKTTPKSDVYKRYIIFVETFALRQRFYSNEIFFMLNPRATKKNEPIIFECPAIDENFKAMIDARENPTPITPDIVFGNMLQILNKLEEYFYLDLKNEVHEANPIVIKAMQYIQEHCNEQISIAELSEKFFLNKYYFSHLFKIEAGVSPKQYLTNVRLSKSRQLLHNENLSISNVAALCGFVSHSDFSKNFKKAYGVLPSEFRK
ncbi:MAG: AraC family transcriptional regulator [Ruminococcus sp.]|nr:AraC family transcriptional regulator [Ruminococcus sp.]